MVTVCRFRSFRSRVAVVMLVIVIITYLCIYLLHVIAEEDGDADTYREIKDLPDEPGQYPIVLWWTPFTGQKGAHRQCGNEVCFFTDQRKYFPHKLTRALMFYGSDFKATDLPLPRTSNHDWALLHEESPKNNYLFNTQKVMEMFNYTATFRRTSDLPLTFQYLESLDALTSGKYFVQTSEKNQKLKQLAPLVYVHSDCDTPSDRDTYVKELQKFIKVDSYGRCLHNKNLPYNLTDPLTSMADPMFLKILGQYKFSLAFENAICDDYITEKLWRPLIVGSVPIYYGSPSVTDWLPNLKSALLVQDYKTPKDLAQHLQQLLKDDLAYESYLDHKLQKKITNERLVHDMTERKWGIDNNFEKGNFIDHFQCLVCERINEIVRRAKKGLPAIVHRAQLDHYGCPEPVSPLTMQEDPHSWWLEMHRKAHHEAKALHNLMRTGRNFSANEFFKEVIHLLETEYNNPK